MEEVDQIGVVGQCEAGPARRVDPVGDELSLHKRPVAGDRARVQSRDPGPEKQLYEQHRDHPDRQRDQPGRAVLAGRRQLAQIERGPHQPGEDQ